MKKNQQSPQLKKIHKQQEEILVQIEGLKKDVSSLLHSMRKIENQIESIENKQQKKTERKKNRLFSFTRNKPEKKETVSNPLSAMGLGDFNIVQMMELLQSPVVQKMFQKFLS